MFKNSIASYPQRGQFGDSSYRGNCTGLVIKDFIESYIKKPTHDLFADPSVGGGTSADVARAIGIRHKVTDLHQGFNLLTDDFASFLGEQANLIWWHPPYWDMIKYSGSQWGSEPHKWDMSRMELEEFIESLELAIMNIHDACDKNGHYGILMGNMRRAGIYYNLSSLVERVAPGKLVDEIIKMQHNCVSDSRQYSGNIIRINHEKLLVFQRKDAGLSLLLLRKIQDRTDFAMSSTWRAVVRRVLQGRTMKLAEIYRAIEPYSKTRSNVHWQAKVRQTLQDERFFTRQEIGVYSLAA